MTPFILITTGEAALPAAPAAPATSSRRDLWADRLGAWLDHLLEADLRHLDDRMLRDVGLHRDALSYDPALRYRSVLGF
jgi:hypothetical protein